MRHSEYVPPLHALVCQACQQQTDMLYQKPALGRSSKFFSRVFYTLTIVAITVAFLFGGILIKQEDVGAPLWSWYGLVSISAVLLFWLLGAICGIKIGPMLCWSCRDRVQ